MRRTALLGLGGLALLFGLIYGLRPSEEVPPMAGAVPTPATAPQPTPDAPQSTAGLAAQPAATLPAAARSAESAPRSNEAATPTRATATETTAAATPRFDVVRVSARGSAVIAGRAAPGSEVLLLLDGHQELGRARADGRGEWVILPSDPLPSGAWELSLRSRLAGEETSGPDAVVVVVPEQVASRAAARTASEPRGAEAAESRNAEPAPGPIAVLIPSAATAAPRILQGPQPATPAPQPGRQAAPHLGMDSVDYEEGGTIRFAGTAAPGATVRVYVGDRHAGNAVADASGRWTLAPEEQPPVGRNSLRVDQLTPAGTVAARIEVPFQRDELPANAFDSHRVVVQPGTNLWRIARATYGHGTRFTVIYQANRDQIRDPHRIFPGQIFDLPEAEAATVVR
ncbi:LysM peptidoglycan-binding domain-containing protein [Roseomonas sp. HJA6]|uniref:LysM peptidoglycan-binding domain-containing protein n=1 Tax=Roseomonas alba TaxID=2846776 RepID=A0ABS7ACR3_9PROT|nr:LysM peptidoglycan-binding domain-containing protein [Neoroseomonas alba]MBW6399953.1 LysM peptidoglycan-binding domain-containing protein [Neoroseomonas alba]